jgi:hypothetical protein
MPRPKQAETVQTGLRIKPEMHAQLDQAAREHGTSLNSEIARRLEQTLHEERALGGSAGRHVAYIAAAAFVMAARMRGSGRDDWANDPECVRAGVFAAIDALLSVVPDSTPEEIALEIEVLKGRLLTRIAMQQERAA